MRKLATAAAVSLALASGGVFGLGLGDIEMQSALNQPMNAEIPLTSVRPGELDGMIVQLASEDAFARAGIERSDTLTDLTFTVDNSSGTPVIRVTSRRPVVEPFLNFLLEVDWPQGRMVREYTVLLDPPVFMTPSATERNTAADQPAVVDRGDSELVPTPIQRDELSDGGLAVDLDNLIVDEDLAEAATAEVEDTPTPAELLGEADTAGQGVPIDELTDDSLLSDAESAADEAGESIDLSALDDGGELVSLTDLEEPNTAAQAAREAEASQAFSIDDIQVELAGTEEEVTDDAVLDEAGQVVQPADGGQEISLAGLGDESDSTIVDLQDTDALSDQAPVLEPAGEQADTVALAEPDTASVASGEQVAVSSGDTLFEIADRLKPGGVSVQQMMMAMLAANESSFINRNINLVRAGAILRVPDEAQANRLTQAEAIAAISEQQQLWREYRDSLRGSGATQLAQNTDGTTAAGDAAGSAGETLETAAADAVDGLSAEAREILENARQEILNREELKIVADDAPSSTTASATADETTDNDSARLGEVNRQLQLAREELASTNLRGDDLGEQVAELESTSENLDALIALRQEEVAKLETQLRQAREAEAAAAQADATGQAQTAENADASTGAETDQAGASDAATGEPTDATRIDTAAAEEAAGDAADTVGGAVEGAVEGAADTAQSLAQGATDAAADAASDAKEVADNALTEAGETLQPVELIDDNEETVAQPAAGAQDGDATGDTNNQSEAQTAQSGASWYEDFLQDPKRMMIAGVGALGLLGVLGTLLFRRKREEPESMLDVHDEAAFAGTSAAADAGSSRSEPSLVEESHMSTTAMAAGGAAVAAGGAAVLAGGDESQEYTDASRDGTLSNSVNEMEDGTLSFSAGSDEAGSEEVNPDDTLAEVDVYLAYGLHGQAEELLDKAVESNPDNVEYANKLLQTYHAQGNATAFHDLAERYHARFGGEQNPEWSSIAAMGQDLQPGHELYSSASDQLSAAGVGIGVGGVGVGGGSALDEGDFASAESSADLGGISRDFNTGTDNDMFDLSGDQSGLMDQSIDPAMAFDEGDLEATGDFSKITSEIASEDESSLEFPGLDETGTAANESIKADDTAGTRADQLEQALNMDDGSSESADDLTLDLDQLSGDLELESSDLLNSDLSDMDIPELTSDDELLLDSTSSIGESGDEMDTMMDLAKAYIDMGDKDSASSALGEIVKSGSPEQVTEAETLLRKIS
ncbi:MAG: hypothetical protein KTR32_23350 [Granulosicoccus sp.]|nr:hypothetical protein [Granulosicoccus sp.]